MKVELKNVKVYKGMSEETTAFNATLYVDGKKAGEASNRGHGDPIQIDYTDTELRDKFLAHLKTLPPVVTKWGTHVIDDEWFVSDLLEEHQKNAEFKRWCKKSVCFRLKDDKPGEYRMIKGAYTPAVKKFIEDKYGDTLEVILNEQLKAGA